MSKKRKLESLQSLGVLTPKDVKQIQSGLARPTLVPTHITAASIRWHSLAFVVGGAYASLAIVIGVAWKLSH